jgi:uncharacterized protein (TIGR02246 family)
MPVWQEVSFRRSSGRFGGGRLKNPLKIGESAMRVSSPVALFLLCFATAATGLATAARHGHAANNSEDKDRAAITHAVQNYMDMWNKHDVHAVSMTYTEDCDFVNNFGDLTHGRAGMEATFGPFMTGVYSETHQTGTVRSIRFMKPDVAAVDVDWEMTGAKNPDGSMRPTRKGLHSLIMTKQSDGSWLIAVMHVHEFTATPRLASPPAARQQ